MNNLHPILQYLIESGICLSCFYGIYILLLRKNTFFNLNRIYLILTSGLSFLIPYLNIIIQRGGESEVIPFQETIVPLIETGEIIFNNNPVINETTINSEINISQTDVLIGIYSIGVIFSLFRFLYQIYYIQSIKGKKTGNIIESDKVETSSFFNTIFFNPRHQENRELIIRHEQVHIDQCHSLDIIYFQLLIALNWFNPLVYLYKKSIREIHEYIADDIVTRYSNSKYNYCSLISQEAGYQVRTGISNHFASLIKKRLIMLSSNQSKKRVVFRYMSIVPVILLMGLLFSFEQISNDNANNINHKEGDTYTLKWENYEFKSEVFGYSIPKFLGEIKKEDLLDFMGNKPMIISSNNTEYLLDDRSVDILVKPKNEKGEKEGEPFSMRFILGKRDMNGYEIEFFNRINDFDEIHFSKILAKYTGEFTRFTDSESLLVLKISPQPQNEIYKNKVEKITDTNAYESSYVNRNSIRFMAGSANILAHFKPNGNVDKYYFSICDIPVKVMWKNKEERECDFEDIQNFIAENINLTQEEKTKYKTLEFVTKINAKGELEMFLVRSKYRDEIGMSVEDKISNLIEENFVFTPAQHLGVNVNFLGKIHVELEDK